jgi:hypothetical protein
MQEICRVLLLMVVLLTFSQSYWKNLAQNDRRSKRNVQIQSQGPPPFGPNYQRMRKEMILTEFSAAVMMIFLVHSNERNLLPLTDVHHATHEIH